MSNPTLSITDEFPVVENDHGWRFCVGKVGDRWIGYGRELPQAEQARAAFRSEGLPTDPGYLHVLSQISEGYQLGLLDRDEAIRRVGALALDPEGCFGGIDRWLVPPELRGVPEDYRCSECGEVCCDGGHDGYEDDV